ncbi:MAG: sulfotransferase [Bdellovibrionales bacterium]|nr:sulfotransferase [Bdellovibrionales bacterium]
MDPYRTTPKKFHVFAPLVDFFWLVGQNRPRPKFWFKIFIFAFKFSFFEPWRQLEKLWLNTFYKNEVLLDDPIIVLGYYRTGTTHLHEILVQDPNQTHMDFYETYFANAFNLTSRIFKKVFGIIMTAVRYKHPAHQVPFTFDLLGEEDVGMVASGFRYAASWGQLIPSQFKNYFNKFVFFETCTEEEKRTFTEAYLDYVRRIWLANKKKKLVLKSPLHTARICYLKTLYPRAKFVYIRRNLHYVVKSNQKLWQTFLEHNLEDFTRDQAKANIFWSMNKIFEAYEAQKGSLAPNDLYEMTYEDLLKDPMGQVEAMYKRWELELTPQARASIQKFLGEKHGQNRDRYKFTSEDISEVKAELGKWFTAEDVAPSVT